MKSVIEKIISFLIVLVLIILLFTFISPLFERIDFWSRISLSSAAKQQVNTFTELLKQRNISELETASFYTELIFPFDFFSGEYPRTTNAWNQLRLKAEGNTFTQGANRTGIHAANLNLLNEDERKNYLFMDAVKVWIDLSGIDNSGSNTHINRDIPLQFVFSIKVKASAGFDLSANDWFSFSQDEQTVIISLPDPKILNMSALVDTSEPWPDIAINPSEFGKLLALLENEFIRDIVWKPASSEGEETGLFYMARDNGERLIKKMFPRNINVVMSEY